MAEPRDEGAGSRDNLFGEREEQEHQPGKQVLHWPQLQHLYFLSCLWSSTGFSLFSSMPDSASSPSGVSPWRTRCCIFCPTELVTLPVRKTREGAQVHKGRETFWSLVLVGINLLATALITSALINWSEDTPGESNWKITQISEKWRQNIARGTTDPGYRVYNLNYLSS